MAQLITGVFDSMVCTFAFVGLVVLVLKILGG